MTEGYLIKPGILTCQRQSDVEKKKKNIYVRIMFTNLIYLKKKKDNTVFDILL